MAGLVGGHVVGQFGRGHDQTPVEADAAVGRAAAPAAFLIPDEHHGRGQAQGLGETGHPARQVTGGQAQVPALQGPAHLFGLLAGLQARGHGQQDAALIQARRPQRTLFSPAQAQLIGLAGQQQRLAAGKEPGWPGQALLL